MPDNQISQVFHAAKKFLKVWWHGATLLFILSFSYITWWIYCTVYDEAGG
jgi:hypothetical protein